MKRLVAGFGRLPWWVLFSIAVGAYFAFQHLLTLMPHPAPVTNIATLAGLATLTITKTLFKVFQYLVPIIMLALMIGRLLRRSGPRSVYRKVSRAAEIQAALEGITWYQFEQLIGEAFRRQGFKVEETVKGADGGVDLVLTRDGNRYLVQCKQWRSAKVSVTTVRELYGVIAAQGALGGFVVTSGTFTKSAVAFAQDRNISLIGGSTLARWMNEESGKGLRLESVMSAASAPRQPRTEPANNCPLCLGPLENKTVKKGPRAGTVFRGCAAFPRCQGTRSS